jgi:hypothetical protein
MDTARPAARNRANNRRRQKAEEITAWADEQTRRADYLLREIGQDLLLAKEIRDDELVDPFDEEWAEVEDSFEARCAHLEQLAEDLQTAKLVIELYANRGEIEAFLADAPVEKRSAIRVAIPEDG